MISTTTLDRGRHVLTAPDGLPATPVGLPGVRQGRRARTARTMTALRIDTAGGMELVEIHATRDGIADAVEGQHPYDVTARFCFRMQGAGYVTFWQADSADDRGLSVNRNALHLLERFLPRPTDGVYDRDRTVLASKPTAGVVVVAGYDREAKLPVDLPEVAVDRFRALLDGREQARVEARAQEQALQDTLARAAALEE